MCRHVAWVGAHRSLASVVLDPPHGLRTQSHAPRRQRHGILNADGWGVGYFPGGGAPPARWRSARPLWGDASFASVAPTVSAACLLAAVRSASPGMPIEETATAPFTDGRWLLSHNGVVDRSVLPPDPLAESVCDAALLAAFVFARGPGELGATVVDVAARDPGARLNVLVTDGTQVLATTWGDTLSVLAGPDGVAVASEPYDDDPAWVDVADRHLVRATASGVTVEKLEV